jgi:ligand-binding SRPBCC domain-containing protein
MALAAALISTIRRTEDNINFITKNTHIVDRVSYPIIVSLTQGYWEWGAISTIFKKFREREHFLYNTYFNIF